jgi:bifunctional UDP-N-acetylglucosamine pyrophosphorylase/glucosamine-1-phosphate N-acetyltransferase
MLKTATHDALVAAGVTLLDPATTYVDDTVTVGAATVLHPGVTLEGTTTIGANCRIRSWVRITDSAIGDDVVVNDNCVIVESRVDAGSRVGPFAHIRPASHVKRGAHVGNFVELKKTVLGEGSKANHLSYLGDATIGAGANIGAGTITCNYDGVHKHPTVIEDGAFIGSDTQLIAPVTVGTGAYVAAGSTITQDVPAGALGVARVKQVNIDGWVERKKKKKSTPIGGGR